MTTQTTETSPAILARIAGFLYLLVVPLGIFALYVSSTLVVSGDAAATASHIQASETLFRLGIVSDMAAALVMLLVVLVLYRLLKPVGQTAALLMVAFLLVGVPISMLNKLNHFIILQLLGGAEYLTIFTTDQLQALVLLFLGASGRGGTIAFVFWGLWLLPLGYLVFKSGFFPRLLGVLLMLASGVYLVNCLSSFLGYPLNIGMYAAIGEVAFILWLLVKGVNLDEWKKRGLAIA